METRCDEELVRYLRDVRDRKIGRFDHLARERTQAGEHVQYPVALGLRGVEERHGAGPAVRRLQAHLLAGLENHPEWQSHMCVPPGAIARALDRIQNVEKHCGARHDDGFTVEDRALDLFHVRTLSLMTCGSYVPANMAPESSSRSKALWPKYQAPWLKEIGEQSCSQV
jgi:hypothetical protein